MPAGGSLRAEAVGWVCPSSALDQTPLTGHSGDPFLQALESLAEAGGGGGFPRAGEDRRNLVPGEPLVDAKHEQVLILGREIPTEFLKPVGPAVALQRRGGTDVGGKPGGIARLQPLLVLVPGLFGHPTGRVPG